MDSAMYMQVLVVSAMMSVGLAQLTYQCTSNNNIQVFGFLANTSFYAMQGTDECTVSSLNDTSIQISNCEKDEAVLLTYGSYSGMETYSLQGGKTVNAVNITCNEIPDAGNTHTINNTFAASLTIDGSQTIDPTYDVTSSLSSASVVVGDEVIWTIDFPVQYILQVTECRAYPGVDASSSDNVTLISMGGCLVSSELISNFTDNLNGTATATIEAFKFYSSDNVFLICDLKICPDNSAQCDTSCTRTKREVDIFKRSAGDGDDELGFYPGRIHNLLTVTDPYASMAMTVTPFGWRFMLTLTFVHFISFGKRLLTSV